MNPVEHLAAAGIDMTPAEFLALSDKRATWEARLQAAYRLGYDIGRADLARQLRRTDPLDLIAEGACETCGSRTYTDSLGTWCLLSGGHPEACTYLPETFADLRPTDQIRPQLEGRRAA